MKALTYNGTGASAWQDVSAPEVVDPQDVILRVDATTICGTDLHILRGDVPEVQPGRILGHEAVGTITQVGTGVGSLQIGDRVLASCISACGRCEFCRRGSYGQCRGGGGWILGHTIDGTQAEQVRIPFADTSTYLLPEGTSDEAALMLADIGPTSYEVGVLNGRVGPGDVVVIVGAGPIGLATIITATLLSPAHIVVVDPNLMRLKAAQGFGATHVASSANEARAIVRELTGDLGADVVIEAVGVPETFELCTELVRPGGHVANIGVHGKPVTLHLESLWIKNVTITTGLVDTYSTPKLLKMVASGQLDTARFVTHRFELDDIARAYDVFSRAAETQALKVALIRA